jgi:hypothetical protein
MMMHRWNPHARRSRVGQKLSDLTSQRVIVLILTMLIMIPGFNWNCGLYGGYNDVSDGGLHMLHDTYLADGNTTGFQQVGLKCASIHPLHFQSHFVHYSAHTSSSAW